jgi:transcriptional regulator
LKEIVDKYEVNSAQPVSVETMTPGYVSREMKGVVGFELTITRIEATSKLSQNRDDKNQGLIINELGKRGDHGSKEVAALMEENRCPVHKTSA